VPCIGMDTMSIAIRTAGRIVTSCYRTGRSHSQTPAHTTTTKAVATSTIMITATRTGSLIAR
jgi:hypothetical protein